MITIGWSRDTESAAICVVTSAQLVLDSPQAAASSSVIPAVNAGELDEVKADPQAAAALKASHPRLDALQDQHGPMAGAIASVRPSKISVNILLLTVSYAAFTMVW